MKAAPCPSSRATARRRPATSTKSRSARSEEKLAYFRELEERRQTVLQSIQEQGKLTPELQARIEATLEKNELEDLYLPFKPKRRTKATIAREKGLEPLAQWLWDQNDRRARSKSLPPRSWTPKKASRRRPKRSKAHATSWPNG